MSLPLDLGGNDLIVNSVSVGATAPGQAGTVLSGSELTVLDSVTPGTAAASKAVVLGASKEIATITTATITNLTTTTVTPTTIAGTPSFSGAPTFASTSTFTGAPTFNGNPILGSGNTLRLGTATATLSSNAATITKYAVQVTTESLTTAAGASQAFTITLTGAATTDIAFVQGTGQGTNTRKMFKYEAACTSNTVTVTVFNIEPTNALNGTLIFNLWILKA